MNTVRAREAAVVDPPVALRQPSLSRATVDRRAVHRHDPDWLTRAWGERGLVLRLDDELTARLDPGPSLRLEPISGMLPADALFLGDDGNTAYFALAGVPPHPDPHPHPRAGLRDVGAVLSDRDAGLLAHAVALAAWHRANPCCPRCGTPTCPEAGGSARRCPRDGSEHHPRTDPAMIVLVTDPGNDRVVLGRAPGWPERRFSCLAGFVEPGESVEQTVAREVAEEVGLTVGELRYLGSQPWPFPASLMLAFSAVARCDDLVVNPDEMTEANWYTRDGLREAVDDGTVLLPPLVSIARRMIDAWLDQAPEVSR